MIEFTKNGLVSRSFNQTATSGVHEMDLNFVLDYRDEFMKGIETTLAVAASGLALSLLIGAFLALIRLSPWLYLRQLSKIYVAFFQNVPLLIIVFFFYYGLPVLNIALSEVVCGLLGLVVYNAAFVAEQIRAGIEAVPKGQSEAAAATGMNYVQTMRLVVLPQAVKIVIPAVGNQMVNIVKGTSVLALIAGGDMMYRADIVSSQTFLVFNVYLIVAVFYLLVNIPLNILVRVLERRWQVRRT